MYIYISTEYWPEHSLFGYGYGLDREIVTSEVFSWLKGFRHFSFSFIVDDIKLKNQEKHVKLSSNLKSLFISTYQTNYLCHCVPSSLFCSSRKITSKKLPLEPCFDGNSFFWQSIKILLP